MRRAVKAQGRQIERADHRRGRHIRRQNLAPCRLAGCDIKHPFAHPGRVRDKPRFVHAGQKPIVAQMRIGVGPRPVDEADPPVPELRQTQHRLAHRLFARDIEPGAIVGVARPPIKDERHLARPAKGHARIFPHCTRQDEAVGLTFLDQPRHGGHFVLHTRCRRHRQRPGLFRGRAADPIKEIRQERPMQIRVPRIQDQAQRPHPPGADRLRLRQRAIPHPLCRARHAGTGRIGNIGIPVQRAADRPLRQAKRVGQIIDRDPARRCA